LIYYKGILYENVLTKVPYLGTLFFMAAKSKEPNEYRVAIENLKQALKQRALTYRELANGIGLSESGIKKIFAAKDGSFQRLAQICRFVGISLSELIEDTRTLNVDFTEQQQIAFLKEPKLFQYYWLLVYERRQQSDVQNELQLSKAESFRLARKLDVLGLIKLLPDDRMRLPSIKAVRWTGHGEFIRKLYFSWSHALVDDLAKTEKKSGELFLLRYNPMTPKTFAEFTTALQTLEEEFIRRSIQEMRVQAPGLEHVRWLVAADNRSFVTGRRITDSEGLDL
jgi:transcriptional regulator with XRE-family HTH domain